MVFSNGWITGLLKRKNLSLRLPTKREQAMPEDYKEKIIPWVQFNRRAQAKFNFELSEIANIGQTPVSFEFLCNKTYDTKGVKILFAKQTGSGWNWRQATLQILGQADGISRCKPLLIFHGNNEDHRQKPKADSLRTKYKLYDPRVEVMFSPKASSNAGLMVEWIKQMYTSSTNCPSHGTQPNVHLDSSLLILCSSKNKGGHKLDDLKALRCTTSFIPGGITDFVQAFHTGPSIGH
jgi:hypothetical protein